MPSESDTPPGAGPDELHALLIFGDPETRRKFLKRIAATSAALSIAPTLLNVPSLEAVEPPITPAKPSSRDSVKVKLKINGKDYTLDVDPRVTLLDALRERLHLTGSKKGCDHGQCGACTVLVNGRRVNSCLTLAAMNDGDEITTMQAIEDGEDLH